MKWSLTKKMPPKQRKIAIMGYRSVGMYTKQIKTNKLTTYQVKKNKLIFQNSL